MEIDTKIETARIGIAAVGVTIWGITLNEWVAIATLIYLGIQIIILTPKAYVLLKSGIMKHIK
jgi:hypothetical protein